MKKFISEIKQMLKTPKLEIIRQKDIKFAQVLEAKRQARNSLSNVLPAMCLEYRRQINLNK